MKKRKQNSGTCVYCGTDGELTRDHIPPRSLFPKPRPDNLVTVPSCLSCNELASKDDEFFHQCILLREDTLLLPEPRKLLPSFLRSFERPDYPGLLKDLQSRIHREDKYDVEGVCLGKVIKQEIDAERLERVPKRIVTGLFYLELGKRLPNNYFVSAFSAAEAADTTQRLQAIANMLRKEPEILVGNGNIFTYRFRVHGNAPDVSQWLLSFYRKTEFLAFTIPDKPEHRLYTGPYVDF